MPKSVLTGLVLVIAGCSASRPELRVGSVPEDFALEMRIGPSDQRRGALYIVEPDRSMHAAVGRDLEEQFYPPQTRVLTSAEMERVYNLLAESGVLGRELEPDEATSSSPLSLYVSAGGRRAGVPVGEGELVDLDPLVRELDRLAWVRP